MWQDIERRSGLPPFLYPQSSPSGVEDEIDDTTRSATLSLLAEFQSASQREQDSVEGQLRQEIVRVTNHAIAVEIEVTGLHSPLEYLQYLHLTVLYVPKTLR